MHDTVAQRGSVSYDQPGEEEKEQIEKQVNMFVDGAIPEIQVETKSQELNTVPYVHVHVDGV